MIPAGHRITGGDAWTMGVDGTSAAPILFGLAPDRWRFRILDLHPMVRATASQAIFRETKSQKWTARERSRSKRRAPIQCLCRFLIIGFRGVFRMGLDHLRIVELQRL
jgi:hypothetical protein